MDENQAMSLEQFRAAKESGVDLYAEPQQEGQEDAAPEQEYEQETYDEPGDQQEYVQAEEDDLPPIPEKEQSAWAKRAERERKKAAEEVEARLKAEYESKYNPYQKFFEQLGVDPETALKAVEQNRIRQEAEQLAYQNGWTDQEAQMYVRQRELERDQTDMRVSLKVYELADSPDYPGIKQMKGAITEFVRNNPNVGVEQAYWAVGGQSLAQQLKREAEQREIAKRERPKRTVSSDAPADMKAPAPLPDDALAFMRRTGMSESQVRMMMQDQGPKNLTEYRQMMKKKG